MERFISTKFFRMLQEYSQKGIDLDIAVLENAANQSSPLVSISLPIYTFLGGKKLFFRGLKRYFSYLCNNGKISQYSERILGLR